MILRPVRPASAVGPPMTNRPLGLTMILVSSSTSAGTPVDDIERTPSSMSAFSLTPGRVMRRDDDGLDALGARALLDGDLGLAVRRSHGSLPSCAPRTAAGQPVSQRNGQRHQLRCFAAGEADHHALVARALKLCAGSSSSVPSRSSRRFVHAGRDVRGLLFQVHLITRGLRRTRSPPRRSRCPESCRGWSSGCASGVGGHLPYNHGEQALLVISRLASRAAIPVLRRACRPACVGGPGPHLVRVTLGHRLRGHRGRTRAAKAHRHNGCQS